MYSATTNLRSSELPVGRGRHFNTISDFLFDLSLLPRNDALRAAGNYSTDLFYYPLKPYYSGYRNRPSGGGNTLSREPERFPTSPENRALDFACLAVCVGNRRSCLFDVVSALSRPLGQNRKDKMTGNETNLIVSSPPAKLRRSSWPILILAVLFVSATFLTWYYTWFGRDLTDSEVTQYLADEKHPRHVQHALLQIQQRLEQGKPVQQWYPRLLELSANPETEFRMTTAWLMGYDNKSPEFHRQLISLLSDPEPMVYRNAALALIRFDDSSGHDALMATLKPFPVVADSGGIVNSTLNEGSAVSRGTMLARLMESNGKLLEIRSPIPGRIERILSSNNSTVSPGSTVLTINSDANSIWEALRGLALIGRSEDLKEIERYASGVGSLPERIKQQAALTAKAIQSRNVQEKG